MKSIAILCLFAANMFFIACKENATTRQEETSAETPEASKPATGTSSTGGHDYTFLTNQLFHYKAANIVGKDPGENPYAGQWIDLLPDGSFKAGILKEQTHTGRWDYNPQAKVLSLRPDDTSKFKLSEWNVMHNDDMVILVGTQTYGNNSTQIQLVRSTELP